MKTLVLGIGNTLLSDEGIGIHVINALREPLVADDEVITASGGSIGPFRYVILHNSTANLAIGYWDYTSSITLLAGETFTVNFGASVLTLA